MMMMMMMSMMMMIMMRLIDQNVTRDKVDKNIQELGKPYIKMEKIYIIKASTTVHEKTSELQKLTTH